MIVDRKFFAESLLVPYSYKQIFKKIHSTLSTPNYPVMCKTYKQKLGNLLQNDAPNIREISNYTESDYLRNVIFLKQAQNFSKLAIDAIPEVKPLLLYYAENQLLAFFINSIFHFDSPSKGHGLTMTGDSYENIGIQIVKSGFFHRIVNAYTILNHSWIFSPHRRTGSGGFEESDNEYSFIHEPTITLKKLIKIKDDAKPNPQGFILDQLDFLFLFLSSSLARYKPDIWHLILSGENGNEIAYFKQTFSRFDKLWNRLLSSLFTLYYGQSELPLYESDYEIKSEFSID